MDMACISNGEKVNMKGCNGKICREEAIWRGRRQKLL
jgi:hypothetical protein